VSNRNTIEPSESSPDRELTWAILLARWTEFARASVALPTEGTGGKWRAAVADIISLQAVTEALSEVDDLTGEGGRAHGLDLAGVQIKTHAGNLHAIWHDEPLPEQIVLLIDDARRMHAGCLSAGVEWGVVSEELTAEHPSGLVAMLLAMGFKGDLYVPTPGVQIFETCPAVFVSIAGGGIPEDEVLDAIEQDGPWNGDLGEAERVYGLRQAYRQFDFLRGGALKDVVLPISAGLPGGQPLLVCAIRNGEAQPVTLPPKKSAPLKQIEVEFLEEEPPAPELPKA
jgi:hypothetical protein